MRQLAADNLTFLVFDLLASDPRLRHAVSIRTQPDGSLFDFSSRHTSTAPDNRRRFCLALGLDPLRLARTRQVHGHDVVVIDAPAQFAGHADALCTAAPGIPLLLLGADCPLIIVFDPAVPALGLVHAGWRGACRQVAARLVNTMTDRLHAHPDRLIAGIGPAICAPCYLVGRDVIEFAHQNLPDPDSLFTPDPGRPAHDPRWHFDLVEANRRQLIQAGIPADRIETARLCTFERPDWFPSYRRDGEHTGRWALLAAII